MDDIKLTCEMRPEDAVGYLKPHKQYIKEKSEYRNNMLTNGRPTGVQCPECDGELMDKDNIILTTSPPQTPVVCNKCGSRTTI